MAVTRAIPADVPALEAFACVALWGAYEPRTMDPCRDFIYYGQRFRTLDGKTWCEVLEGP